MPIIGLLSSRSPAVDASPIAFIRQGLNETGLVEGQNVALNCGWAEYDRLAGLVDINILNASTIGDIDVGFAKLVQMRADALLLTTDAFFFTRPPQLVVLAARHAIPTVYFRREFAAAGGLMSYGANPNESYRLLGVYAARILKGEKPGGLPIQLCHRPRSQAHGRIKPLGAANFCAAAASYMRSCRTATVKLPRTAGQKPQTADTALKGGGIRQDGLRLATNTPRRGDRGCQLADH